MVRLYTNTSEYFLDIADELRLFLEKEEITQAAQEAACNISVTLERDGFFRRAKAVLPNENAEYAWECELDDECDELEVKRREKRAVKIAAFRLLAKKFGFMPPWGSLTGIRPTRLMKELCARHGEVEAERIMQRDFDVSDEKLALAREINAVQQKILNSQRENDVDIYVGIPYCASRCLYCSFASMVRTKKTDMSLYLNALKRDIELGAQIIKKSGRAVRAMYMGGGTPTILTADELDNILEFVHDKYPNFFGEFTVEAGRPDTITKEKLAVLKKQSVTRISINPQTMNEDTLELIGRSHTPKEIVASFNMARDMGFDNINMDIIAGLPGEGTGHMERTLEQIYKLAPENLTVHTLALKRSSRLVTEGEKYPMPTAQTVEKMLEMGESLARAMGMRPYYMYRQKYMSGNLENVGYAKPGFECAYNIDMMEDTTAIMAHGAGVMTKCVYDAARRVERVPAPKEISVYIAKIDKLNEEKEKLFL